MPPPRRAAQYRTAVLPRRRGKAVLTVVNETPARRRGKGGVDNYYNGCEWD